MPIFDSTTYTSCVYFIRFGRTDLVKIGKTSRDVRARLESLQAGSPMPLHIMGIIADPPPELSEGVIHRKFKHLRVRREWFKADASLNDFIDAHADCLASHRDVGDEQSRRIVDERCRPGKRSNGRPRATDDPFERSKHIRCLVYRVHDRKTVREVAEIMGISERAVRKYTAWALTYVSEPEVAVIRAKLAENLRERRQRRSA